MLPQVRLSEGWASFEDVLRYLSIFEEKWHEEFQKQEKRIRQVQAENLKLQRKIKQMEGITNE